jgi:hypothetical protein
MTPELLNQLHTLLDHILETEVAHYEESGEPDAHIYALALEAKVALKLENQS